MQELLVPECNFLQQKLGPVERTHTDRDGENRRTYRFFFGHFFNLISFSMSCPKITVLFNAKIKLRRAQKQITKAIFFFI